LGGNALAANGTFRFLAEFPFQRYFNRAVLLAALVLFCLPSVRFVSVIWASLVWNRMRAGVRISVSVSPSVRASWR
jgi:hypothetical protein